MPGARQYIAVPIFYARCCAGERCAIWTLFATTKQQRKKNGWATTTTEGRGRRPWCSRRDVDRRRCVQTLRRFPSSFARAAARIHMPFNQPLLPYLNNVCYAAPLRHRISCAASAMRGHRRARLRANIGCRQPLPRSQSAKNTPLDLTTSQYICRQPVRWRISSCSINTLFRGNLRRWWRCCLRLLPYIKHSSAISACFLPLSVTRQQALSRRRGGGQARRGV